MWTMEVKGQGHQRTLVLCLAMVISVTVEGSGRLNLLPNDPEGLVGQDMRLWCSLSNDSLGFKDLHFTIVYKGKMSHKNLSANNTVFPNKTTAMLTLENLTDSQDGASVFCLDGQEQAYQIITVGRLPPKPVISYYRYLNWESFIFKWTIQPKQNGFGTKYTAWFKSSSDADFTPCDVLNCEPERMSNCIRQDDQMCSVPTYFLDKMRYDGIIYFKVNGSNKAGTSTSEISQAQWAHIVEPGPIKNLKFRVENGVDVVLFQRPAEYVGLFYFKFRLQSKENPSEISVRKLKYIYFNEKSRYQNETLRDLKPNVKYELSIRTQCYPSRFWSKWENSTFTSHEEAPSQAPDVCRSCFEKMNKTWMIHFKPLTKEQSRGKEWYRLKANVSNSHELVAISNNQSLVCAPNLTINVNQTPPEIHLNYSKGGAFFSLPILCNNISYHLEIFAQTSAGRSLPAVIELPRLSEMAESPTNCSVMTSGVGPNQVILRWNNTNFKQRVLSFTIIWCKGQMVCQDPIEWEEVSGNESSLTVQLKDEHSLYMFGMAATTLGGHSSGIHWSCSFYSKDSVASKPHINQLRIEETFVEIQLGMPPYNPREGLVYGYNLYYSAIDSGDEGKVVKIYVEERSTRGVVRIERLSRGTSYWFRAESLTLAGPSEVEASIDLTTKPFNFTSAEITAIVSCLVILSILALIGLFCCLRFWLVLVSPARNRAHQTTQTTVLWSILFKVGTLLASRMTKMLMQDRPVLNKPVTATSVSPTPPTTSANSPPRSSFSTQFQDQ